MAIVICLTSESLRAFTGAMRGEQLKRNDNTLGIAEKDRRVNVCSMGIRDMGNSYSGVSFSHAGLEGEDKGGHLLRSLTQKTVVNTTAYSSGQPF